MVIGPDAIQKNKKRLYIHIHDHLQVEGQNRQSPFRPTNPGLVRLQAYQKPSPEMARRLKLDELKQPQIENVPLQTINSVEYLLRKKGLQKLANTSQANTQRESTAIAPENEQLLLTGTGHGRQPEPKTQVVVSRVQSPPKRGEPGQTWRALDQTVLEQPGLSRHGQTESV